MAFKYYPEQVDSYELCNNIMIALEESHVSGMIHSMKVKTDREGVHLCIEVDEEITNLELLDIKNICMEIDGVLC